MKKILFLLVVGLVLTGCEGDSGDTYNVTAGGDAHIGDSTITYDAIEEEIEQGVFSVDYNQEQCNEAGFFYCTTDNVCVDAPLESGSCDH